MVLSYSSVPSGVSGVLGGSAAQVYQRALVAWLFSLFLFVLVGAYFLLFRCAKDYPQVRLQAVAPGAEATVMFAGHRGYVIVFNRH